MKVPSCLHPVDKRDAHEDAARRLDLYGHGIGGGFQYTTLWGETASAFVTLADSPIVCAARSAGYQALFALQNVVLQKAAGKYGVRGHKFSSVDNFSVSKVALLGFWKQYSEDVDDHAMLALRYNQCGMTAAMKELNESNDDVLVAK